jgi:hypothetical protein
VYCSRTDEKQFQLQANTRTNLLFIKTVAINAKHETKQHVFFYN